MMTKEYYTRMSELHDWESLDQAVKIVADTFERFREEGFSISDCMDFVTMQLSSELNNRGITKF